MKQRGHHLGLRNGEASAPGVIGSKNPSHASEPTESGTTHWRQRLHSNFVRLRANYFVPVVPVPVVSAPPPRRVSRRSWRPSRRVSRRSWRPARRSPRFPLVWASAPDTVSTVAGTAKPNAAVTPRRENAVRREIRSDLIFSVIFKPHLSSLLVFSTDLCDKHLCQMFLLAGLMWINELLCSILNTSIHWRVQF